MSTLDCGHAPTPQTAGAVGTGSGTGSATFDGTTVCYACATLLTRLALKRAHSAGQSFSLYLADSCAPVKDSKVPTQVHTWSGDMLGAVYQRTLLKGLSRIEHFPVWSVRVRDVHGNEWYGRGSVGCVCTLRPLKGKVSP